MADKDKDIELDDVKEYKPKKRKARFMDNYNLSPLASAGLLRKDDIDVNDLDNGVMLSTSEIIDFSEGTDSWTTSH